MKTIRRIFLLAIIAVFVLLPQCVSASDSKLVDDAGLLSQDEYDDLDYTLENLSDKCGLDIVVVTKDGIDNNIQDYTDDYYDYHDYGQGSDRSGVILLIDMDTRQWHISTTGYGITALTDYGIDYIGDEFVSYLSDGYYYRGFSKYADLVEEFTLEAREGKAYDVNNRYGDEYSGEDESINLFTIILIGTAVGIVISVVIILILVSQLKNVRFRYEANDYMVHGSMKIVGEQDVLINKTISKSARSSSNGSGGSSTHTSSSGTSHGGGGGHF